MEGRAFLKESVIAKIKAWFNIVNQAHANIQKTAGFVPKKKISCEVGWKPPVEGWIQLQSDGSVRAPNGNAAAGGLFRDHLGRCLGAYVCNLGRCSITDAELRGALEGLRIAWKAGYRKNVLHSDSTTAINIIEHRNDDVHRHGSTARHLSCILDQQWEVRVSHVYREANYATDYLANKAHDFDFGTHQFNVCDRGLVSWINHDVMGTSHERFIVNMI
ncbi:unnamed protein product [Linum tenue]|uniref:RNase H type-1 domain-containing protein n=1 Tax=Linum tenue TaxID=586396 RepID=A0AAV0NF19_9ROSI|nr:unnamed protein product [Linum tenue]